MRVFRIGCLVIMLSSIIVMVIAGHSLWAMLSGADADAEIGRIRASGAPTTAADLSGPKLPDSTNGGVIYEKAIKAMSGDLALLDKSKSRRILRDFLSPTKRQAYPRLWSESREIVARNRQSIALVEQASRMPICRLRFRWQTDGDLTIACGRELDNMRTLCSLVCVDAILHAHDGDMNSALRDMELGFSIGESLKRVPCFLGQLVRYATIAVTSATLRQLAGYGALPEAESGRLYDLLSKIELNSGLIHGLEGERAQCIVGLRVLRKTGSSVLADKSNDDPFSIMMRNPHLCAWFINTNMLFYLEDMQKETRRASHPWRQLALVKALPYFERKQQLYALFSALIMPIYVRWPWQRDMAGVEIVGSRIFMALHAYHDRFHAYPRTLDDLKAKLAWPLPEDPFSGKPFIYRLKGSGFLLYSIGPNLKDDGGRPRRPGQDASSSNYDIVWEGSK
jgi:hypothetical protein